MFGRNRDAADFSGDRTLSGRLTVLYGQSGLGKSSLLRALVIPNWRRTMRGSSISTHGRRRTRLHALKEALIQAASAMGVADPGRGSPTLVELVRLINNVKSRPWC